MEEIGLRVKGSVHYFNRDDATGLIIPGTEHKEHNTIVEELSFYLAYKIGTNTINQALSSRFTVGGTISASDDGDDGIAYGTSSTSGCTHKLDTDVNAGGDLSSTYIEYVGSIAGPLNMTGYLQLGHDYDQVPTNGFRDQYAFYNINTNVESGQTFYFYWRLTIT